MKYSRVQFSAVQGIAVHCIAVQCFPLQCSAFHCIQYVPGVPDDCPSGGCISPPPSEGTAHYTLHHTILHYTLHHATQYSTLHSTLSGCTALKWSALLLVHCIALHHIVLHCPIVDCNALYYNAPPYTILGCPAALLGTTNPPHKKVHKTTQGVAQPGQSPHGTTYRNTANIEVTTQN